MSVLKVNNWYNTSNTLLTPPLKFTYVTFPYSTAAATLGYTTSYTTANTAQLYSFSYTPISASSTIMWMLMIDADRNNNGLQEHLCVFVDGTFYSNSFLYPRNSGDEPYQHNQSGSYTNSSTAAKTFSIRCGSGGGWTQTIGKSWSNTTGNAMANTMIIWEYPR